jgi:NACHT domain
MTWVSSSNGELLWLNGKPGSGKSSLMSTIAHWARQMGEHGRLGAFLRFDSEMMNDSSRVITTLAYRLAEFDDRIGDQISKVVKEKSDIAEWPLNSQFQKLIVKPLELVKDLKNEGPIVVLVDALDKLKPCDLRSDLLEVLAGGFGAELPFMRLIVSSPEQGEDEIVSKFKSPKIQHIPLDVSAGDVFRLERLNRDILLYFEHQFRDREIYNTEFHALYHQHNTITKLTEHTRGLFIWAFKIARFIKSNPNKRLRTILNASGPTDLEAALDSGLISNYTVDPNCNQGI